MGLYGKKKDVKESGCCCGGNCNADTMAQAEAAKADPRKCDGARLRMC